VRPDVLEFDRVMQYVAGRAAGAMARDALLALRPRADLKDAEHELDRVADTMQFLDEKPGWSPPAAPDVRPSLERLAVEGSVLEPEDLFHLGGLLSAARRVREEFDRRDELPPALNALREQIFPAPEFESRIEKTVDAEGFVLDTASRELGRLRDSLRGAQQRLVRRLEAYMETLGERIRVPDASVSVREGRYVIPVRREGRREVGGIVHDESGTGATIFVEPPVAVEGMNELRELEVEEKREIQRILRELTGALRPHRDDLRSSLHALVELDALHARARVARGWDAAPPTFVGPDAPFAIVGGRHPLLLIEVEQSGSGSVIPFDLALEPEERTLVVSGPNTGGKSVFLKAFGLVVMLARAGVIPPVRKGTTLPPITQVFADIGDDQSIERNLSTFSAHLETLRQILAESGPGTLVLIDEMGTGTDPTEGAALARAILEELTSRGARTIATSHLGALKTLDTEGSGIVNASLEFDSTELAPTYRLVKGRPGRSYGLAIARRQGMPAEIMDRAEAFVDQGAASLEDLLERLETREREAAELVKRLDTESAEVTRLKGELQERDRELARRERTAEKRASEEAHQLLMDAREEVEQAIRQVKSADAEERDEAATRARRQVEEAAARQKERARERARGEAAEVAEGLEVGARVRVGSGATGHVVELRDRKAAVEVSGLRMEIPAEDLTVLPPLEGKGDKAGRKSSNPSGSASGSASASTGSTSWSGDAPQGSYELDLRGLRVDEVGLELGRGLDGAILSGLHEVRIIHGKGTGAVKARVQELLKAEKRVESFRGGHPGEGGGGVTVAVFR